MIDRKIKITFITPCFCRGADCSDSGEPEIRPASIRGQLHWWFRRNTAPTFAHPSIRKLPPPRYPAGNALN
jgi:CRISPR type III-B/RAMP module RAMP protein Cmr1